LVLKRRKENGVFDKGKTQSLKEKRKERILVTSKQHFCFFVFFLMRTKRVLLLTPQILVGVVADKRRIRQP